MTLILGLTVFNDPPDVFSAHLVYSRPWSSVGVSAKMDRVS